MNADEIVARLGGHPARLVGLDASDPDTAGDWFVLACLLSGRLPERAACAAWRALSGAAIAAPRPLAAADPRQTADLLAAAGHPRAQATALRLRRASSALVERCGGEPAALAAGADDLPDLAESFVRLAPGVGPATVLRFLRPLRDAWPAAREVPLTPAARAAGLHLGWLRAGQDEEGEPGALRAALAAAPGAPPLADVEAALERLGTRACLRDRRRRCPLGDACPAASGAADL